jgi:hypothetical protein
MSIRNLSWPILLTLLILNSGCTLKSPVQTSVLVIIVENLGFASFSCGETESEDDTGFKPFCEEAVRFTHAYAPSPLSQASVASILTAQYPPEHGVRHNGSQFLSATIETLAERARARGLHTSFYSGGPPIWRRSGFNQGFEVFDDAVSVSTRHLYRPARTIVDSFLAWQDAEAPRGGFLSFLHFADAQFTNTATTNELGELRDSSYTAQIEEVSQTLRGLVRELKKRGLWDSTEVVLAGLNGYAPDPRAGEPLGLNLFSESTHVTLMIKPSRSKGVTSNSASNWKIDANVSLVDLGATLFDFIDPKGRRPISRFNVVSLKNVLQSPDPDWSMDREIVSESAWPEWRKFAGIRAAVRKGSLLFIYDQRNLLFDTLSDNLETTPIPWGDLTYNAERVKMANYLDSFSYQPWAIAADSQSKQWIVRTELGRDLWRSTEPPRETRNRLRILSELGNASAWLMGWRARIDIRSADWQDLLFISANKNLLKHESLNGLDRQLWKYVADKNLGRKSDFPEGPCVGFLRPGTSRHLPKECADELARDLAQATDDGASESSRSQAFESLAKRYSKLLLIERVAELNYATALKWDTSFEVLDNPNLVDLLLALPEFKKLKANLRSKITRAMGESN